MARYVDVDALIAEYDRVHVGPAGGARKLMVDAPTADVAPKSEVAREIIKEIRHEIELALESNYKARKQRLEGQVAYDAFVSWVDGKIAALRGIDDFIDYIEKKYTEGEE